MGRYDISNYEEGMSETVNWPDSFGPGEISLINKGRGNLEIEIVNKADLGVILDLH